MDLPTFTFRRITWLWCFTIVIVTAACYSQVYRFQFVYDSVGFVLQNPHIHEFSVANVTWILQHAWLQNWQPITWLSHTLDFSLFGTWAGGHHLVNAAIHIANSLLLYLVIKRLFGIAGTESNRASWIAGITVFVFAIHPQHVESVVMVAERKDMLYGLLSLLCTLAYIRYTQAQGAQNRFRWLAAVMVLFALDLMAKPMAVTLPVIFIALDLLLLGRLSDFGKSIVDKLPLMVMAALVSWITLETQKSAMFPWGMFTTPQRLAHAIHNVGFYTEKFIAPVNLSPYYPFAPLDEMLTPHYWLPGLIYILIASSISIYAYHRDNPGFLFGWLFFAVTLAPVSGFLQVGSAAATDHYTYLATIPYAALLAWFVVTAWYRWPRLGAITVSMTLSYLVALTVLTWIQIGFWASPLTLWSRALELYPSSRLPRRNLAIAYLEAGALKNARQQAIQLDPPDPALIRAIEQRGAPH